MHFPRLYAILDIDSLTDRSIGLTEFADGLRAAGISLIQYRNKRGTARQILHDAAQLRQIFPAAAAARPSASSSGKDCKLILNDRADLGLLANFDGVHVGQEDLSVEDARNIVGPDAWVGVSTHNKEQVIEADRTSCNYIAYGPVFPTASKGNPDPVVGVAGLRVARTLTRKPLVAIGGITRGNCRAVLDVGADSVAVVSDLIPKNLATDSLSFDVSRIAEEFLRLLGP